MQIALLCHFDYAVVYVKMLRLDWEDTERVEKDFLEDKSDIDDTNMLVLTKESMEGNLDLSLFLSPYLHIYVCFVVKEWMPWAY